MLEATKLRGILVVDSLCESLNRSFRSASPQINLSHAQVLGLVQATRQKCLSKLPQGTRHVLACHERCWSQE